MANVNPANATVTVIDPKVLKAVESVKADTEAILAKLADTPKPPEQVPTYWPRGYFG